MNGGRASSPVVQTNAERCSAGQPGGGSPHVACASLSLLGDVQQDAHASQGHE